MRHAKRVARSGAAVIKYFALPCAALRPYIDRYWGWRSTAGSVLPTMLPGTGAELMFHCGAPIAAGARAVPMAHLLCVRNRPLALSAATGFDFVAVRVRAGALRHLCRVPLAALFDCAVAVEDMWGGAAGELAARVREANGFAARVALIERWLLICLARYRQAPSEVDAAVRRLYYEHAHLDIERLTRELHVSRRHLERQFLQAIGCSPKHFQRSARFHQTARELLLNRGERPLLVALDHGYYDQAHFIRDFQAFAGLTPGNFLRREEFTAHFYNPSHGDLSRMPTSFNETGEPSDRSDRHIESAPGGCDRT